MPPENRFPHRIRLKEHSFDDAPAKIETGIRHGFHSIRYFPTEHDEALDQVSHLVPEIRLR